jgi:hypothetical protein
MSDLTQELSEAEGPHVQHRSVRALFLVTNQAVPFFRKHEAGLSSPGAVGHDPCIHVLAARAVAELALDTVFETKPRVPLPSLGVVGCGVAS